MTNVQRVQTTLVFRVFFVEVFMFYLEDWEKEWYLNICEITEIFSVWRRRSWIFCLEKGLWSIDSIKEWPLAFHFGWCFSRNLFGFSGTLHGTGQLTRLHRQLESVTCRFETEGYRRVHFNLWMFWLPSKLGTLNFTEHMNPIKDFERVDPNSQIQFTLPGVPPMAGWHQSRQVFRHPKLRESACEGEAVFGWVVHGIHNDDTTFLTVTSQEMFENKQTPQFSGIFPKLKFPKKACLNFITYPIGRIHVEKLPNTTLTHPIAFDLLGVDLSPPASCGQVALLLSERSSAFTMTFVAKQWNWWKVFWCWFVFVAFGFLDGPVSQC